MLEELRRHFAPYNEDLFELCWAERSVDTPDHAPGSGRPLGHGPAGPHGLDGDGDPVQRSSASAAWCTSMPETAHRPSPRARPPPAAGCTSGW